MSISDVYEARSLEDFYRSLVEHCAAGHWVSVGEGSQPIDCTTGTTEDDSGIREACVTDKADSVDPRSLRQGTAKETTPANELRNVSGTVVHLLTPCLNAQSSQVETFDPRRQVDNREIRNIPLESLLQSGCRLGIATSGTTGRPKVIWHRLDSICRTVRTGSKYSHDRWGFGYSPSSFAGLQVFFQAFANDNQLWHIPIPSPNQALQIIRDEGINRFSATPSYFKQLCSTKETAENIESATLGGEKTDLLAFQAIKRTFPNAKIRNVYASTEAGALFAAEGESFVVPSRYVDKIRIREGQLELHRSLLADSMRDSDSEDLDAIGESGGFFATGDLVEIEKEDPLQFRIISRVGDWINVGGVKVDPLKVESAILGQPGVTDARVFGRPSSVLGSIVCAEVVCDSSTSLDSVRLKQSLQGRLSRVEVPQIIEFVERLQLNATGKKWRR